MINLNVETQHAASPLADSRRVNRSQLFFPLSSRPKPERRKEATASGGIQALFCPPCRFEGFSPEPVPPPSEPRTQTEKGIFSPANRFFLRYPFRDRPRERMRLRARAKWVPTQDQTFRNTKIFGAAPAERRRRKIVEPSASALGRAAQTRSTVISCLMSVSLCRAGAYYPLMLIRSA